MDAGRLRVEREEVVLADAARGRSSTSCTPLAEATGPRLDARGRPGRLGARRRGARAPDRARARRQRARAHAAGDARSTSRASPRTGRARCSRSRDDGPGIPRRARRAGLRPLLPRRGAAGVRERARARDRPRARGAHGRHGRARERRGPDDVHALAAGRRTARRRASSPSPREHRRGAPRFHVETGRGALLRWP